MTPLRGGRGKVMWLDPEDPAVPTASAIRRNDANITSLAEILQPFAEDRGSYDSYDKVNRCKSM